MNKPTEQDVQELTSTADLVCKMQTVLVNERVRPTLSFTNTKSIKSSYVVLVGSALASSRRIEIRGTG